MLDPALVRGAQDATRFLAASVAQDEGTGALGYLTPSPTQRPVLRALSLPGNVVIDKCRQAHTSTACLLWLLKEVEYTPGYSGLLVTDRFDTSKELFHRVLTAYRHQPDSIRVPVKRAGFGDGIEFVHGGRLRIASAESSNPGIGHGIDRLVLSEFGMWSRPEEVMNVLLPAIQKRAHGRTIIESTPGPHGSAYHRLWAAALSGDSTYSPVFIAWWKYRAYEKPVPPDFEPTSEEQSLLQKYGGMTTGHLQFRREFTRDSCFGDSRLFARQYPLDPVDGWTTTSTPALPEQGLRALYEGAQSDPGYLVGWTPPVHDHAYMVCADPNSYGQSGDPSAYTLVDLTTRTEVGAWSGRIDPVRFAHDLARLGKSYSNALLVVESNAAACITALTTLGYPKVWQDAKSVGTHPGYYRTSQAKQRAIGALVSQLQEGQFTIRSRQGLTQLLAWDGQSERQGGHHWDRVVTYCMAADMMNILRVRPHTPPKPMRNEQGMVSLKQMMQPTPRRPAI